MPTLTAPSPIFSEALPFDDLPSPCDSCPHAPSSRARLWERHQEDLTLIATLRAEIEDLKGKVHCLNQTHFGRSSEKDILPSVEGPRDDSAQPASTESEAPPSLSEVRDLMAMEDPDVRPKRSKGHQPGRKGPGRTRHLDLPAEVETLRPDQTLCSHCHAPFIAYGSPETAEILEIEVRPYRRIIRRPRFRKACSCSGTPATLLAPPAPRLIPKGKIGVSLWVTLLREKFDSNQPTARRLKDLERHGLHLSPGTITDGLRGISEFFSTASFKP